LPAPGGLVSKAWCPPPAATSPCPAPRGLADHVPDVGRHAGAGQRTTDVPGQRLATGPASEDFAEGCVPQAPRRCRPGRLPRRWPPARPPGADRRGPQSVRRGARHGYRAPTVEAELAQKHQPVDRLLGHRTGGREHRSHQCEVNMTTRARLGHRRLRPKVGPRSGTTVQDGGSSWNA
jgi:hypothetical protein